MSQRQTKKLRKLGRKMFKAEVGTGLEALQRITRPRPKWIPKRVWVWVYLPLFEKKYLPFISENID